MYDIPDSITYAISIVMTDSVLKSNLNKLQRKTINVVRLLQESSPALVEIIAKKDDDKSIADDFG